MMAETRKFTIRRILVPLAAWPKPDMLEMAASLAAGFEAELVGIYLREPEFLTAASLPVSRFSYSSRAERKILDVANMERALKVRAAQLRAALEATARRRNLRWSFQDITGDMAEMIDKAVHDFDLVTLNHAGPALPDDIGERVFSSFSMMRQGISRNAPVVVLLDGEASPLEPGAELAKLFGCELNILIMPQTQHEEMVKAWLSSHNQPAKIILPREAGNEGLLSIIEDLKPGLLVMNRNNALRQDKGFSALISRLDCPLFLVAG